MSNIVIRFLFVSLFVPSLTYGQSIDIDNVNMGRDVKSLTVSKVDDIKIERLPKGCIKKSGWWFLHKKKGIDCFALQVEGLFINDGHETKLEKPLWLASFETIKEAKEFSTLLSGNGREFNAKYDSVMIFGLASITYLHYPLPKNKIQLKVAGDLGQDEIFLVSRVSIPFNVYNSWNWSRLGLRVDNFEKNIELEKEITELGIKPTWKIDYSRTFLIFTQVTSKIYIIGIEKN